MVAFHKISRVLYFTIIILLITRIKIFLNNDTFLDVLEGKNPPDSLKGGVDLLGDVSKTAIQKLEDKI